MKRLFFWPFSLFSAIVAQKQSKFKLLTPMSQSPIISVITVCRNDYEALQRTYESLKNQTRFDLIEWIVIDGASDDKTPEFLVSLSDEKFKPAFWSSKADTGIYDAMNKGMDIASAYYLIFLNAGDLLADDLTIDFLVHTIPKFGADFIYGDSYEHTGIDAVRMKKARPHQTPELGMFTHHQAMLFRRDKIGDLRYDTRYKIAADYDFVLRFLKQTESVHYLPEPICIFHAGGVSQTQTKLGRDEQFQIRKELGLVTPQENKKIYLLQYCNYLLRRFMPRLYWHLKQQKQH